MGKQSRATRALAIGRKIAELETELRPLVAAIAELKHEHSLLFADEEPDEPEDEPAPPPPRPKKKRRDEWQPLPARIMDWFAEHPSDADIDVIAEGVGHENRQTMRATLVTLYKEGKLVRVSKGVYAPAVTKTPHALVLQR